MTTTTPAPALRLCAICGTADMPTDPKAKNCAVNGCNILDGEAYKAVARLRAAMRLSHTLIDLGASSFDAAEMLHIPVARRLAERAAGLSDRSDATWAMAVYLMRGDAAPTD